MYTQTLWLNVADASCKEVMSTWFVLFILLLNYYNKQPSPIWFISIWGKNRTAVIRFDDKLTIFTKNRNLIRFSPSQKLWQIQLKTEGFLIRSHQSAYDDELRFPILAIFTLFRLITNFVLFALILDLLIKTVASFCLMSYWYFKNIYMSPISKNS